MYKFIKRAWTDTSRFYQWSPRVLVFPILLFFGFYLHGQWAEKPEQPCEEVMLWLTYTLVPVCALALLIFIWNMILAPYRIEKDARLESDGISKDKIELLSEKNLHLQSTVDASNSPKGKIRSILASINPSILNDVDNGNDRIYIVATVAKFQALVDACDNPKGRQLCAKIAEHGQDSGSNSRMGGGGEPHRDSSDIGWKTHFTLYPLPALIERVR